MNEELLINTLKEISTALDNVKYDLCGRQYLLHEDEMSTIFFCRDLADKILWEIDNEI